MNYRFAFYHSSKIRTQMFGRMLAEGARRHGDTVDLILQENFQLDHLEKFDGGANLGMALACKRLMDAYRGAGRHFIYFDKGYFDRDKYWRLSIDGWQPLSYFQRFKRGPDRMKRLNIKLGDRRKSTEGMNIVLAGACQNYHNFCDLPTVTEWCTDIARELGAHSSHPVVYRPNPSWAIRHEDEFAPIEGTTLSPPQEPFAQTLARCHLLVTHGSSAALAALARGIPVFIVGDGICKPMSPSWPQWWQSDVITRCTMLEHPHWPHMRLIEQFFQDVTYCQWTPEEYRSGVAWEEVRLALAYLRGKPGEDTPNQIIRQYQIMHKSQKYFRGLSVMQYRDVIQSLIKSTKSRTLLDYGCGKGDQYLHPYKVNETWGVSIALYDPAIGPYAALPAGRFDGIICVDVMEHVPEAVVPDTLRQIIGLADKFVFFAIASAPANKSLPDGRNCHVTVRSEEWWRAQIAAVVPKRSPVRVEVIVVGADDADD